jgi:hypothetical protein
MRKKLICKKKKCQTLIMKIPIVSLYDTNKYIISTKRKKID